jgi:hypothetical protein
MNARPPDPIDPPAVRARLAERYFLLAREGHLEEAEREEFRRMARAWARTLPGGPERDRIMNLDEH